MAEIEGVQLFDGLDDESLVLVKGLCEDVEFYNKERIFKEGDDATHLWFVRDGMVDLRFDLPSRQTTSEQTITTAGKNKAFGWSALIEPHLYGLSAYSATDYCAVSKIERKALQSFLKEYPAIGFVVMSKLAQVIATRFRDMQEEMAIQYGQNIMDHW